MNNLKSMKALLSVVDPDYSNGIPVEEIREDSTLLNSAIKLAEKNGLYYYFILRLKDLNTDIPFLDKNEKRWEEEKQKLSGFKETITLLNEVSKEQGIDYLLIKACTKIPHVPRDVDIFIQDTKQRAFVRVLEGKGMSCIHSDNVDTTLTKGEYIKVDLYTALRYFTIEFIDGDFLWDSYLTDKIWGIDYPGLKSEANFLVMLVHSLFGHGSMSLLDFLHMKSLMDEIRDMDICRKYAYESGWGSAFDLTLGRIESINEKVYKEGEVIYFPYMFNQKFIFQCISEIEGLDMTRVNKMFFYVSLIHNSVICNLKDTPIYNLLKSFEPTRKLFNSLGYYIRTMRGDKRSGYKQRR